MTVHPLTSLKLWEIKQFCPFQLLECTCSIDIKITAIKLKKKYTFVTTLS